MLQLPPFVAKQRPRGPRARRRRSMETHKSKKGGEVSLCPLVFMAGSRVGSGNFASSGLDGNRTLSNARQHQHAPETFQISAPFRSSPLHNLLPKQMKDFLSLFCAGMQHVRLLNKTWLGRNRTINVGPKLSEPISELEKPRLRWWGGRCEPCDITLQGIPKEYNSRNTRCATH
ncbi:hypothetical protein CDAR_37921 [Caerostris darwini]|uniref:Uncharacterized protein n=1 Tax=Caerostris darwini TaxID=1538125 RepID=A0AAV4T5I1_9ARAC|nr:hypothetical protein CDAR_37921 [Caerostris darwini]